MVLVRRIHKRGANIVVEANAEILFTPQGEVTNWLRSFSAVVGNSVRDEAPINKRPRWIHYGKPLKETITASTRPRTVITGAGRVLRAYSAVGSSAPHARYVNDGTGSFQAKILPPWHRGSASLYEHTWRPGPGQPPIGTITVRGQEGQHFFEKGLKRGFEKMGLQSRPDLGEGLSLGSIEDAVASALPGFKGNTEWNMAFDAQLREWRLWRDAAWKRKEVLGEGVRAEHIRRHVRQFEKAIKQEATQRRRRHEARKVQSASIEAATKRRREQQVKDLVEINRRKELGRKKREEADAKRKAAAAKNREARLLRAQNATSEREAREFFRRVDQEYKNAFIGHHLDKGTGIMRWLVRYTDRSGTLHREYWP